MPLMKVMSRLKLGMFVRNLNVVRKWAQRLLLS
jgi:hypothetical protein